MALSEPCRDYGFRDQTRRSALSIPSNISDLSERQTDKEFNFFMLPKDVQEQLRTHLYLDLKVGYLEKEKSLLLSPCALRLFSST